MGQLFQLMVAELLGRVIAMHLVPTFNKELFQSDKTNLLLGEWCNSYKDRRFLSKHKIVQNIYHWDDREKLYRDYLYLKRLNERLLNNLQVCLNEYHKTNLTLRGWRIIIGPWLGFFIQIAFERWENITSALSHYDIDSVSFFQISESVFQSADMKEFNELLSTDNWNQYFYQEILSHRGIGRNIEISQPLYRDAGPKKERFGIVKKYLSKISFYRSLNSDFFFIAGPKFLNQIKLDLYLNQKISPYKKFGQAPKLKFNENLRKNLTQNFEFEPTNEFEVFLKKSILKNLPSAYLEGFSSINKKLFLYKLPKKPKLIFTKNSYLFDDFFKIWCATKVDNGSLFVIGQHGGHYGSGKWSFTEEHEIEVCDYFFSWGWNSDNKKILRMPSDKLSSLEKITRQPKDILQVIGCMPRYSYHLYSIPVSSNQVQYFEDQIRFANLLKDEIKIFHKIRLYPNDYGWDQEQRFIDNIPNIKFDSSRQMTTSLETCKLFIGTYNATTFLETLSLNIPTLIFWNPNHWELNNKAEKYYNCLKEVGIFHHSPDSAADFVNKNWDRLDSWWNDENTQSSIKYFCEYFAKKTKSPMRVWSDKFKEITKHE